MAGLGAAFSSLSVKGCPSPKDRMWAVCKRTGTGSSQILTKRQGPSSRCSAEEEKAKSWRCEYGEKCNCGGLVSPKSVG